MIIHTIPPEVSVGNKRHTHSFQTLVQRVMQGRQWARAIVSQSHANLPVSPRQAAADWILSPWQASDRSPQREREESVHRIIYHDTVSEEHISQLIQPAKFQSNINSLWLLQLRSTNHLTGNQADIAVVLPEHSGASIWFFYFGFVFVFLQVTKISFQI